MSFPGSLFQGIKVLSLLAILGRRKVKLEEREGGYGRENPYPKGKLDDFRFPLVPFCYSNFAFSCSIQEKGLREETDNWSNSLLVLAQALFNL